MYPRISTVLGLTVPILLVACGGGGGAAGVPAPSSGPSIAMQPSDQNVAVGQAATFTVTATGASPLNYEWLRNTLPIAGATASKYTTPATAAGDNGATFTVVVTDPAGSATSRDATLIVTGGVPPTGADVLTYKNDLSRTGQNLSETTLIPANVNAAGFGLLRFLPADGKVDAQPLYVSHLNVAGSLHNVLLVATEHDSVYAFDADTGIVLWQMSLLAANETLSDTRGCSQVVPEIGITSTPVIDRSAGPHGTLYVVAMSKDASSQLSPAPACARYSHRRRAAERARGNNGGLSDRGGRHDHVQPGPVRGAGGLAAGERIHLYELDFTLRHRPVLRLDHRLFRNHAVAHRHAQCRSEQRRRRSCDLDERAAARRRIPPAISILLTANGAFEASLDANGFPKGQDYGNSFLKISTGGRLA